MELFFEILKGLGLFVLLFLFISYLNRYKEYKTISIIAIIREAIRAVIQVGAGFLSLGVFSLSMGYAVSPLFGLNIQMRNYLKELKERPRINLKKFKEIKSYAFKDFRMFGYSDVSLDKEFLCWNIKDGNVNHLNDSIWFFFNRLISE